MGVIKLVNQVINEIFRQMTITLTLGLDVPVRPMEAKGLIGGPSSGGDPWGQETKGGQVTQQALPSNNILPPARQNFFYLREKGRNSLVGWESPQNSALNHHLKASRRLRRREVGFVIVHKNA